MYALKIQDQTKLSTLIFFKLEKKLKKKKGLICVLWHGGKWGQVGEWLALEDVGEIKHI